MRNLKLEELSVEQKIGMVLCARSFNYADEADLEFTLELVRNHALGCVQGPYKKPEVIAKILEAADYPIIMVLDMEMGFPTSKLPPVPMMTLAACNKPESYHAFAKAVLTDAREAGFNGTWGPVIDVLVGDGPCKVYRTFSDQGDKVAVAAEEIAKIFAEDHFMSCGKHFPGSIAVDTHMTSATTDMTMEELMRRNLIPYMHLQEKGLLPSIMTSHTNYAALDPEYPASLSKPTIDVIRQLGFDGVCFTDSFGMMAILQRYGEDKILGMAIAAGNDIVLPNYRRSMRENYETLLQNYRDGMFSEERLNEAVGRVLALQEYLGSRPETPVEFTEEDRNNYYNIAKDCITAITDPGVDVVLDAEEILFVVVTESNTAADELAQEMITRPWYDPENIIKKISEEFPKAEIVTLPEFSTAKQNEKVLVAASRHKEVVFVTFCNTRPYLGTDCLTRRTEAVINSLIGSQKLSTLVHFGNPYALQPLKHIKRKIFGYMMPASQQYAIEALSGKIKAEGTLPFDVQFQ